MAKAAGRLTKNEAAQTNKLKITLSLGFLLNPGTLEHIELEKCKAAQLEVMVIFKLTYRSISAIMNEGMASRKPRNARTMAISSRPFLAASFDVPTILS